ncbi:MAG: cysteine desulfurase family protein [Candidatus Longimicrobiales bacterium M2_2A_002]
MTNDRTLYLDHAATTPVRPAVREAMELFLADRFGNPSSTHGPGRAARAALEEARERVAAAIGADPDEIVFTGGGTEADNLAVLGRWRAAGGGVVVSAIEHSAVRRSAAEAADLGAAVTTLAVDEDARVDLDALDEALETSPGLVSVMWGNNEVGAVQPVAEIARRCREHGVTFHTDAVQAVGHIPVSVGDVGCDLLAMSAHKFGGPKGVGALYVRRGTELRPLLHGGGQERGLRAGTSNVAGAVGLAEALERAVSGQESEAHRLRALRDRLERGLLDAADGTTVNAAGAERLPHILSVSLPDIDSDVLLASVDLAGLAVSSGSACHSGASAPSHVLLAMGAPADAVLRFSLGWPTTEDDVERALAVVLETMARARGVDA